MSDTAVSYAKELKNSITTIALVAGVWVVTGTALLLTAISTRAHGKRVDAKAHRKD